MRKPPELIEPDERWQLMLGDREGLEQIAASWPDAEHVRDEVAAMLRVARDLFVHSYFVYEFGVVSVTWSLLALEAGLRDCLAEAAEERDGLTKLIGKAQGRGWLTADEGERLRAGAQLRNRLAHARGQTNLTVGMTAPMLEAAHQAIVDLYARSGIW